MSEDYFEANRQLWNERTQAHVGSDFYRLEDFKKGWNPLNSIELNEMGDVKGKSLLHLQCHFGMDTLAWQRMGASCTGVDLSDASIDAARRLNDELGLGARFVLSNVYDLRSQVKEQFDIVFTSYGTIGWLPDLTKWAEVISASLKPGGLFCMADFHPVVWMFDNDFTKVTYAYHRTGPIVEEEQGTYADRDANIKLVSYGWNHSISETLNALIESGLRIEAFNEYPHSPYNCFNNTVKGEDGYYRIRGMEDLIPMVYSIRAVKPL